MKAPNTEQDKINTALWSACQAFKGTLEPSVMHQYFLGFMLVKYISDLWQHEHKLNTKRYGESSALLTRKMNRVRFVMSGRCLFSYLYEHRNDIDIGEKIDRALSKIEDLNPEKITGLFHQISFNDEILGLPHERHRRLRKLFEDFSMLDFCGSSQLSAKTLAGNASIFLIERFARQSKEGSSFGCTPANLSTLVASLLEIGPGVRIGDPTCGTGSLLIAAAKHMAQIPGRLSGNFSLYGQSSDRDTCTLARLNFLFHGLDSAHLTYGHAIKSPRLLEGTGLKLFDVIISKAPFTPVNWGYEHARTDRFKRFIRGIPPRSKGDYAFVLHIVETMTANGKAAVIVPHGLLFRGGTEAKIRQHLIEDNLIDAVIGLPPNLLYGTGAPVVILIFKRSRSQQDILFIDASNDYQPGKNLHILRQQDMDKVTSTYKTYQSVEGYATRASRKEIATNEFNLSLPRYVRPYQKKDTGPNETNEEEIIRLEQELKIVRQAIQKLL